jgi:predicted XRE-type DNA-binding protein
MDAFSRLLAAIGQSLGKGLGQVGQTELEQRQRLEVLEVQRKAQVSGQLLQTFTQLLQTQGIQEVAPEGIDVLRQAVTDLALGKVDSPKVQEAVSVFPVVAQAANKIAVYRELATKDLDALSRLIVNTNPEEAQRFLRAVGLQGMYEGLRTRGEILTQADQLGLQLTKEKIGLISAQRTEIMEKLGPSLELLRAQAVSYTHLTLPTKA